MLFTFMGLLNLVYVFVFSVLNSKCPFGCRGVTKAHVDGY